MSNDKRVSSFSDLQVALAVDSWLGHQSVIVGRNVLSLLPIESEAEVVFDFNLVTDAGNIHIAH